MRRTVLALAAVTALAAAAVAAPAAQAAAPREKGGTEIESMPIKGRAAAKAPTASTAITYHNGPVMTNANGVNAYVIWYGAWDNVSATPQSKGSALLTTMLQGIGGTPYFNINTTYTDAAGTRITNKVTLAGQTTDAAYSLGKRLTDANVKTIVSNAITKGKLPKDANGVYFVLTAKDVTETSGFLTKYCGWHTHATIATTDIKYSFVGDPSSKLANCAQQLVGPNGATYAGADAMVSVIAHELEEAATDPDLNAWYDGSGAENADKCAWTFGTTSTATNGAKYNVTWGGTQFLIQQNWLAGASQGCAMAY
jgi:hypothetical protein